MNKIILCLALISAQSFAATLKCTGTVDKIGLHAPDKIMLKLSSMNAPIFICNPNAEWVISGTSYKTKAETCKLMMSMFMHAKATKADMGNIWFDGDDVPESCDAWGSWKAANVRYFVY